MFTGLVQARGTLAAAANGTLRVRTPLGAELAEGDSVSVSGVCLTATEADAQGFTADVVAETLSRTSLGELGEGDDVNLELPLRATDRLGGHVVQGHVDGVGEVQSLSDEGVLRVRAAPEVLRYVVEKGSIAVDGVSLTVAALEDESFSVALIPETLERTTLGDAAPGRRVNLEVDVFAKYVERLVRR